MFFRVNIFKSAAKIKLFIKKNKKNNHFFLKNFYLIVVN